MASKAASYYLPDGAGGLLARGRDLMRQNRPYDALQVYARAARHSSSGADAFAGFALACLRLNEVQSARDAAGQALARDRQHVVAWFVLGAACNALGERADAIRALEHATRLDPAHAEAQLVLGHAYSEVERADDALQRYRLAVAANPADAEAHVAISSLYYRAGRAELAMVSAAQALAVAPNYVPAHQNMARLLADAGREDEAKAHRDKAYAKNNIMVFRAPKPERRVLVLTTATDGNTPDRHLLPAAHYTRLYWFIEYANVAQIADPPPHDVVFNAIADPDWTHATAANVERFLAASKARVINSPRNIARTARHRTAELFAGIDGIEVPRTVRIGVREAEDGIAEAARRAGLAIPYLVRPAGSHGGEGLELADHDGADILARPARPADHYLTAFREFRSADGWYRKYRMFFVDRRPYPYHLAIGSHWLLHYVTAGMAGDETRLAEERRFLEDPEAALGKNAYRTLSAIGERMDLDFCGIDFSLLPDGRVLVFEANATMLVHPEPEGGPFAHKNVFIARILEAFRAVVARD